EIQESKKQNSLYEVVLWVEQNSAVWKDYAVEENLATQQKKWGMFEYGKPSRGNAKRVQRSWAEEWSEQCCFVRTGTLEPQDTGAQFCFHNLTTGTTGQSPPN
ncbi:hypothetical protein LEMLEM_LOCUS18546, partial [Lemmus lemmus]